MTPRSRDGQPIQIGVRAPSALAGFEQWHVHQTLRAPALSAHLDRFAVTTQAPGEPINCAAKIRGRVYENAPVLLQCYNPGDVHVNVRLAAPETYYLAFFSEALIEQASVDRGRRPRGAAVYHPQLREEHARFAFSRLHETVRAGEEPLAQQEALESALTAFLGRACEPEGRPLRRVPVHKAIHRTRELLHERCGETVLLDELADAAGLNKYYLLRTFKAYYGVPPMAYSACSGSVGHASSFATVRSQRRSPPIAVSPIRVISDGSSETRPASGRARTLARADERVGASRREIVNHVQSSCHERRHAQRVNDERLPTIHRGSLRISPLRR